MKTTTMYYEDLEEMFSHGCSTPGCTHENHGMLYLAPRCHPGAGVDVFYKKGSMKVTVECHVCQKPVVEVMAQLKG